MKSMFKYLNIGQTDRLHDDANSQSYDRLKITTQHESNSNLT